MNNTDRLYIINGKDIISMTINLLKEMNPLVGKDESILIGIKPNLVCASKASNGATTHPEIVEAIILYLKENGFNNIIVLESSWVGANTEDAADVCGYTDLCSKYDIPFINIKDTKSIEHNINGFKITVSEYVDKVDYLINVPLIKGHCQTDITCALKNMKGLISDGEKRRYHRIGLHKPIAYLNTVIKQDLIIADAVCPDPYFEEGGRPKQMDMIVGAYDPVLMDSYAAKVLGYEPLSIEYVAIALELGIGKLIDNKTGIIKICDGDRKNNIKPLKKKYLNLITEDDACSACYSHLVMAMEKLYADGLTNNFTEQICIGQGFKKCYDKIGIGDCTSEFENHAEGCPPSTEEMIIFLYDLIDKGSA